MGSLVNYQNICDQVAECAMRAGRDPAEVRVVAVSKTVGEPEVREALAQGAGTFGENRPELLAAKATAFPQVAWHMIGTSSRARFLKSLNTRRSFIRCARCAIWSALIAPRQL